MEVADWEAKLLRIEQLQIELEVKNLLLPFHCIFMNIKVIFHTYILS